MRSLEVWTAARIHSRRVIIASYDHRLSELRKEGTIPESPERTALITERRKLSSEQGVDKGTLRRIEVQRKKQLSRRIA